MNIGEHQRCFEHESCIVSRPVDASSFPRHLGGTKSFQIRRTFTFSIVSRIRTTWREQRRLSWGRINTGFISGLSSSSKQSGFDNSCKDGEYWWCQSTWSSRCGRMLDWCQRSVPAAMKRPLNVWMQGWQSNVNYIHSMNVVSQCISSRKNKIECQDRTAIAQNGTWMIRWNSLDQRSNIWQKERGMHLQPERRCCTKWVARGSGAVPFWCRVALFSTLLENIIGHWPFHAAQDVPIVDDCETWCGIAVALDRRRLGSSMTHSESMD